MQEANISLITEEENLIQERQKLLKVTVKPFLEWFRTTILELHQATIKQKIARGTDVVTGLLASAIVAPLGYEFGILVAKYAGIEDPETQKSIALYFSITATTSGAVLVSRISNSVLEKLVTSTPKEKKALMDNKIHFTDAVKILLKVFLWSSAACSAIPESYLAYQYFNKPMGLWSLIFVSADMEALTIKNGWAIENLSKRIFSTIKYSVLNKLTKDEIATVRKMRLQLRKQLGRSMMIISQLSDNEVNDMVSFLFKKESNLAINASEDNQLIEKAKALFNPQVQREIVPPKKPIVKTLFGYFGSTIGAVGAYTFYPIATSATEACLDFLGIEDSEGRRFAAHTIGGISYIARGALAVYATQDSFEKFYDWFANIPNNAKGIFNRFRSMVGSTTLEEQGLTPLTYRSYLRGSLTLLATIISLSGGGPRAAMTNGSIDMHAWYAPLLITCAFIGAFSTNFWAVHGFVKDTVDGASNRMRLMGAVMTLLENVSTMEDEHIKALYEQVGLPITQVEPERKLINSV